MYAAQATTIRTKTKNRYKREKGCQNQAVKREKDRGAQEPRGLMSGPKEATAENRTLERVYPITEADDLTERKKEK
ncbi:hypothetical protein GCM10020227_60590 [Streptomyces flavovirens]